MARTVLLHVGTAMTFRRSLLTAAFLLAIPTAAHAGSYASGAVGTSPDLGGDVSVMLDAEGHNTGRLALGQKLGPASIEGGLAGFRVTGGTVVTASLALKLQASLSGALGMYARGSLDRTWVSGETMDLSGDGHTLGVGLDYGVSALADGGVWLELDRQYLDLEGSKGTADTVMLGIRIGL